MTASATTHSTPTSMLLMYGPKRLNRRQLQISQNVTQWLDHRGAAGNDGGWSRELAGRRRAWSSTSWCDAERQTTATGRRCAVPPHRRTDRHHADLLFTNNMVDDRSVLQGCQIYTPWKKIAGKPRLTLTMTLTLTKIRLVFGEGGVIQEVLLVTGDNRSPCKQLPRR